MFGKQTRKMRHAVVLDKTIFHPQGGGQPADDGTIVADDITFIVKNLQSKDDTILHLGSFTKVISFYCSFKMILCLPAFLNNFIRVSIFSYKTCILYRKVPFSLRTLKLNCK